MCRETLRPNTMRGEISRLKKLMEQCITFWFYCDGAFWMDTHGEYIHITRDILATLYPDK